VSPAEKVNPLTLPIVFQIDPQAWAVLQVLDARIEVLEDSGSGDVVYVPPDTIVQTFPDGSVITYRKEAV